MPVKGTPGSRYRYRNSRFRTCCFETKKVTARFVPAETASVAGYVGDTSTTGSQQVGCAGGDNLRVKLEGIRDGTHNRTAVVLANDGGTSTSSRQSRSRLDKNMQISQNIIKQLRVLN